MSHPFGDLISQHLHRKHGLSQSKLAAGIIQEPTIITKMCKGQRLNGPQARERVVAIIGWLHQQGALDTLAEANAVLDAAGMSALREGAPAEAALLKRLPAAPATQVAHLAASAPRSNLPAPLTTFIGREREIAELTARVQTTRLLTLTGSGGVGKSRLALEVAHAVSGTFADGMWLVELAPLSDPTLVPQTVVSAFKLPEQAGRTPLDVLIGYLETKHLLLILDNCEHLIDACASLAEALLQRCPQLHVLATSRDKLRVPGEATHRVPSLTTPDGATSPDDLLRYEAMRLFCERAITSQSMFEWSASNAAVAATICSRLDGIPLAIELAVARLNVLSIEQIAERLNDRFSLLVSGSRTALPRHQTLRAAITWSYDLLSPLEQTLLIRLSVFVGGFTAEAAEFVFGQPEALTLLSSLVDKSLVIAEMKDKTMRYRLLETIRQFAHEQLVALGKREDLQQRHAAYFLTLAEKAEEAWDTFEERDWLSRLEVERDNLQATIRWAIDQGNAEFAQRFNASLFSYWIYCSRLTEARGWLEASLALRASVRTPASIATEAKALNAAGYAAMAQGDYTRAWSCFERAVTQYSELGDKRDIAWSLRGYAYVSMVRGDLAQAQPYIEQSLMLCGEAKDEWGIAWSLYDLGYLKLVQGDLTQAQTLLEEALERMQKHGIEYGAVRALLALGIMWRLQNELARAQKLYREALELHSQIHYLGSVADCLEGLAGIVVLRGQPVRAVRLFSAAQAHRKSFGWLRWIHSQATYEQDVALARGQLEQDAWSRAWNEGHAMTLEQALQYAVSEPESPTVIPSSVSPQATQENFCGLTEREREAVALIAQGKSNREIAEAMVVSVKTVETYVTRILGKLGFDSRVQIATWAMEKGMTTSADS
jgi:non-specific serine/threonine protein kinase